MNVSNDPSMKTKILVVDDIPDYADIIEKVLNNKGFICEVTSVIDAKSTLEILTKEKFPILILDHALKGSEISGLELIEKIIDLAPNTIIIFSTGAGSEEIAVEALQKGAYDYLVKNVSFTKRLIDVIFSIPSIALEGFQASDIHSAVFKIGARGTEIVYHDPLPFLKNPKDELTRLGTFYLIAIGQGDGYNEGLFGPLPISNTDYTSLLYSFCIADPTATDERLRDSNFIILTFIINRDHEYAFSNRSDLLSALKNISSKFKTVDDFSTEKIIEAKDVVLQVVRKTIHERILSRRR